MKNIEFTEEKRFNQKQVEKLFLSVGWGFRQISRKAVFGTYELPNRYFGVVRR